MSPASRSRNVLGLLGAFIIASIVAGVLAAGLFLPAVGATGITASKSVDFFDSLPSDLQTPPLPEGTTVLSADGKVIARFFDQNRASVPLDQISTAMKKAIVAIEDARFYEHGGIDPQALLRASVVNLIHGGNQQGGSTLTQQYVKNVLVQTAFVAGDKAGAAAATAKGGDRKIKEIRYAISLEQKLTKDEILNRYLNIVNLGGSTYGVEKGGLLYFSTHAKDLNVPQAAMLAGMVRSPGDLSPFRHPEAALARRNTVLQVMRDQSVITPAQFDKYSKQGLGLHPQAPTNGCANTQFQYGFFCDYVKNLIERSDDFKSLGKTEEERSIALLRGGFTIRTTLSPKIQLASTEAVNATVPSRNSPGVGAASVTVEPGTGKVRAIAENRTWDPDETKRGHTATNFAVDSQWGGSGGFQTGSTFKPFTLATWLNSGKSLNATVSSAVGTAPFSAFHAKCEDLNRSASYTYYNSEGGSQGNMSVFKATYASVNGAYVSMEKQLDLCDIRDMAEKFGLHLASPQDNECTAKQGDMTTQIPACIPSLTLGVKEISPMTMAAAYAGFAARGVFCKPIAITSIEDRDGKDLKVPQPNCHQVLDQKVADTLTYGLSRVFSPGGTAYRVGGLPGGRPASGKTGTSNNSVQTWFCGYTTKLATAVWVGVISPKLNDSLNKRSINGRTTKVFGATYAAPIWKQLMTTAVENTPIEQFAAADKKLTEVPTTRVPDVGGLSIPSAIAKLKAAGFTASADGGTVDSAYPAGTAAGTSPSGTASTGSNISISISNGKNAGGGNNGGGGGGGGGIIGGLFPPGNG